MPPAGDDEPSSSDETGDPDGHSQPETDSLAQKHEESEQYGERPLGPEAAPLEKDDENSVLWWVLKTDHPGVTFLRDFLGSMLVVAFIGLLLFAISGVWPPMVAVESGSMEPHMYRGDLVFVMDQHRFVPESAVMGTGIVTHRAGQDSGYRKFGGYGDVIIYEKNGGGGTPIIHRARFWVNESENWYGKANKSFLSGDSCSAVPHCPAHHAGFVTKGDNNDAYDQVNAISSVVKPEWIKGTAVFRIPWLGHVRLLFS